MKKNLIITASDQKYGDFLIEHWLRSIRQNVNLLNTDISVIDYGLSRAQRFFLKKHGVKIVKGERDGHVTVIRYRDILTLLKNSSYEQVLACDGGDIIFQDDITHLFETHREYFRAVCEDTKPAFFMAFKNNFFSKEDKKEIHKYFIMNRMINAGFVVAPREKMIELCQACVDMIKDTSQFGPDQLVVNYLLHKQGFIELSNKYNYVVTTAHDSFFLSNGFFYLNDKTKIPVVHNAGNLSFFRPIENFGYGSGYNILKEDVYKSLRTLYKSSNGLIKSQENLYKSKENFINYFKQLQPGKKKAKKRERIYVQ